MIQHICIRRYGSIALFILNLLTVWSYAQEPAAQRVVKQPAGAVAAPLPEVTAPAGAFLVKPYLQWGDATAATEPDSLVILWQTEDVDAVWTVDVKAAQDNSWRQLAAPTSRRVAVPTIAPHRIYRAVLSGFVPGATFEYRVRKAGIPVFSASARARKGANQPHQFVVFGDCAAGTASQKAIAYQTYQAKPDYVFITGDIVYSRGLISEYRAKFFPVYNADEASPITGAPLLRSTLFVAAPGNHDIGTRDLDKFPDGLAYFLYWSQPLNGPIRQAGADQTPTLEGSESNRKAFLDAAGRTYPRMANFSFDYGNAHWTVLDANTYVDLANPALRAWLERDLASAQRATWRFVGFHQPGFNSSRKHFDEQRMRLLAEVFERGSVDIAFSGHVHNYQRSYPLRFVANQQAGVEPKNSSSHVDGTWILDKEFDGKTRTKPAGVLYLVTGAGGANLYDPEQDSDPSSWQEFTYKFISKTHSLTLVDVTGTQLTVRQISEDGSELDRFTLAK